MRLATTISTIALLLITLLILATTRLLLILPRTRPRPPRVSKAPAHLLIVLGSGGHTAEMLAMLSDLDTTRYKQRTYVVSEGDLISATKAVAFEDALRIRAARHHQNGTKHAGTDDGEDYGSFTIYTVPRARRIHQSVLTAPWTCLVCLFACVRILLHPSLSSNITSPAMGAPDLILTNGPATSTIVTYASILLRFFGAPGHSHTRIVYVESFARVQTLSLSALCVAGVVDRLLVQWRELEGRAWGRAEFAGLLALRGVLLDEGR